MTITQTCVWVGFVDLICQLFYFPLSFFSVRVKARVTSHAPSPFKREGGGEGDSNAALFYDFFKNYLKLN